MIRTMIYAVILFAAAGTLLPAVAGEETRNEIALVAGATETPAIGLAQGSSIHLNSSIALGAEYDRRIAGRGTALYVGADFLASPADVKVSFPPSQVSPSYASLFLAPHARLEFQTQGGIRPWLLFGGGYADFAPSQPRDGLVHVAGQGHSGTLEFGGGVDTQPLLHLKGLPLIGELPIGTRLEVRDFYSGQPNYGVPTKGGRQNNISFAGGLLLRF
jgi:hypothetical protein